ncbi:MAG: sulfite exporter TauE/SafE family protein [Pseudomonadota bacterium]
MVDAGLALAALAMGVAGTPHCAAMCGAPCSVAARASGGTGSAALPALLVGRLAGYAAAGALAASSVTWLVAGQSVAPILRPLWAMLHATALVLGLWMLWQGAAPAWMSAVSLAVRSRAYGERKAGRGLLHRRVPAVLRSALGGTAWALLPCGLLQSALLVASLSSDAAAGALVMAAFAASSSVALWAAPALWSRWGRGTTAAAALRLAGGLLAAASGFALFHGMWNTVAAWCSAIT